MLNIGFWNVHGLNDQKLDDEDFQSCVNSFDIIGFAETLGESPGNLPEYISPFVIKAKKRKRRGRPSGGIAVYCKPNISKSISILQKSSFSIWLKLEKSTFGLSKPIFLCFCYIKPYISKDESELIFTKLQTEILKFKEQGEILVCGDFNARTSGLSDFIQNDEINVNINECPVPSDYQPDCPLHRSHMDSTHNLHGTLLTNICKDLQHENIEW